MKCTGKVYLVGAGPGDPDLITVRGLHCLQSCDTVVYDRLVHSDLVEQAPAGAERIFAGGIGGSAPTRQQGIHSLMVERARTGHVVVRLKGGDPFLFGRGGEELLALTQAGVPCQVVSGVSSALAVPARGLIPLTFRGVASSVGITTGHLAGSGPDREGDWSALARLPTLVVLMGVGRLPHIVEALLQHGRDPRTPAALIASGTLPEERVIRGPLARIGELARQATFRPPATLVVGDVVEMCDLSAHRYLPPDTARIPDLTRTNRALYPGAMRTLQHSETMS